MLDEAENVPEAIFTEAGNEEAVVLKDAISTRPSRWVAAAIVLALSCLVSLAPFAQQAAFADDAPVAAEKSETVTIHTDASGSVLETVVDVALKNPNGSARLSDATLLDSIEARDGVQYSSVGSTYLTWEANGKDVAYKGMSSASAPISLSISYTLDGQPISPQELAGKSGRVTIRYDYENHSSYKATVKGKSQVVNTPYTCITALMLDGESFKNISVENGKVIEDGHDTIVAGYVTPGLKSSLGSRADKADIPDHFMVSADVSDFELKSTMTIVTAGLMSDFNTESLSVDEIDDAGELSSAMLQLVQGSDALTSGLDDLARGADALHEGTSALKTGAQSLESGLNALVNGSGGTPGLAGAASGASELVSGLESLDASMASLADESAGLPAVATTLEGLANTYGDEAATVAQAQAELAALVAASPEAQHANLDKVLVDAATMSAALGQVAPGARSASEGVKAASAALASIVKNAKSLPQGLSTAVEVAKQLQIGAAELEGGASSLGDASGQLASGAHEAASGSEKLGQGMREFDSEGLSKLVGTLQDDFGGLLDRVDALALAAKAHNNFSGITPGTTGSVKFVFETDAISGE